MKSQSPKRAGPPSVEALSTTLKTVGAPRRFLLACGPCQWHVTYRVLRVTWRQRVNPVIGPYRGGRGRPRGGRHHVRRPYDSQRPRTESRAELSFSSSFSDWDFSFSVEISWRGDFCHVLDQARFSRIMGKLRDFMVLDMYIYRAPKASEGIIGI